MIKTKWLIDNHIIRNTSYDNLQDIIKLMGYDCMMIKPEIYWSKSDYKIPYSIDDCVVPYTSINTSRKIPSFIGSFFQESNFLYHKYTSLSSISYNDYYLNSDGILITFSQLKNNKKYLIDLFGTDSVFIRPNSGSKLFTGFILKNDTWDYQVSSIEQLTGTSNDSLILISSVKNIVLEARFIIVDKNVVAGSTYFKNSEKYESPIYPHSLRKLADIVAQDNSPPSPVYTCDIGILDDESVKIIELNSFNCAGWYAADIQSIISSVSEYTRNIYNEINIIE